MLQREFEAGWRRRSLICGRVTRWRNTTVPASQVAVEKMEKKTKNQQIPKVFPSAFLLVLRSPQKNKTQLVWKNTLPDVTEKQDNNELLLKRLRSTRFEINLFLLRATSSAFHQQHFQPLVL